ncbi:Hypothetical_protein [Hexamita inflata]|uniref:Hypothetical_protein n=1 Tax=Hexamita inflata TaxID=28002 RepID=A0AA86NVE1_9EUKA|nr:Hypothetical protein HINF_LOCUS13149 [Hexamita inflata]
MIVTIMNTVKKNLIISILTFLTRSCSKSSIVAKLQRELQSQFDTAATAMCKFKETKKKHDDKKIMTLKSRKRKSPQSKSHKIKRPLKSPNLAQSLLKRKLRKFNFNKQHVLEKLVKHSQNEYKTITDAKQESKPILTKAQNKKLQIEYQKQFI